MQGVYEALTTEAGDILYEEYRKAFNACRLHESLVLQHFSTEALVEALKTREGITVITEQTKEDEVHEATVVGPGTLIWVN